MNKKLEGNTAFLCLSNHGGITIKINESEDGVYYQWYDGEIEEAEIEYIEDTENITGYAEEEDGLFQAAFKIGDQYYFLAQFMRNNY